MKKFIKVLLTMMICVGLIGCNKKSENIKTTVNENIDNKDEKEEYKPLSHVQKMNKIITDNGYNYQLNHEGVVEISDDTYKINIRNNSVITTKLNYDFSKTKTGLAYEPKNGFTLYLENGETIWSYQYTTNSITGGTLDENTKKEVYEIKKWYDDFIAKCNISYDDLSAIN